MDQRETIDRAPRSLYIHLPFCRHKCSYCDFVAFGGLERQMRPYLAALMGEVALWGQAFAAWGQATTIDTLYLGGGTPTYLPLDGLRDLLATVRRGFPWGDEAEVSIEANPVGLTVESLSALRRAGVNRLSLGVQSVHPAELDLLSRNHDAELARVAVAAARAAGFPRLNVDLIYGLPGQGLSAWQQSVERVLSWEPNHLSLYGLQVEEGTVLAEWIARGQQPAPDPDLAADMYEWVSEWLAQEGFEQYELSNWARPGHACRHNLTYWRLEPYLGLGCGAHSLWAEQRFAHPETPQEYAAALRARPALAEPDRWLDALAAQGLIRERRRLAAAEQLAEALMLGLRLNQGIDRAALTERYGAEALRPYETTFDELAKLGLLARNLRGWSLTPRGRLLGNAVFEHCLELVPPLSA